MLTVPLLCLYLHVILQVQSTIQTKKYQFQITGMILANNTILTLVLTSLSELLSSGVGIKSSVEGIDRGIDGNED